MIDYVEILDTTKTPIGIIDTAKSIIWHSVYFGCGDFEIYIEANEKTVSLLSIGNYVTRNDTNDVGIIESINVTFNLHDGYMIVASGRFAKSILDRRLIYNFNKSANSNKPTVISGLVEVAARKLVLNNAINCAFDHTRNIPNFALGQLKGFQQQIVDENGNSARMQVSFQNLLEYTDSLLQEYGLAAKVHINESNKNFLYTVYTGTDRSTDNTGGYDPVILSTDYDNLNESNYLYDITPLKNSIFIGGEGQDIDRFFSRYVKGANTSGLQLREVFLDASSLNKTMKGTELFDAYPTGSFVGLNFVVNGVVYATLVTELDKEYTLSTLQEKFPTGTVSGAKFVVSGVTYARAIYGADDAYNLTALGYRAMLTVDGTDGDYEFVDTIYARLLNQQGKLKLREQIVTEEFDGEINVSFGTYQFNRDYFLGDTVTIQDNRINQYINKRITEATEVQDENGYSVSIVFGE
jgi:hypothetical protein